MINDTEKLDILATMAYYASIKKYAIQNMLKIKKPLSNEDLCLMNILYGTYFTYLIGLIDFLKEHKLLDEKDIKKRLGNDNNYYYVRNLRNAIVHRGEEIANCGIEISSKPGIIAPRSPVSVCDPKGENRYHYFTENLFETVRICENLNSFFLQIITGNDLTNYPDETEETFKKEHEEDPYLPPYAKTPESINLSWKVYSSCIQEIHKRNVDSKLSYFNTEYLFI